ncbi:hypothetical protein EWM64_g2249 [Hericium alpestre]|uniref:Uncharacterized protein n=1 Tax=Hericium alpestre TaxID=135208 RepID=A0A4Z0A4X4_9AGAM|nr:hypothetical protein EWM64_g2249 [Hericium alpestre]
MLSAPAQRSVQHEDENALQPKAIEPYFARHLERDVYVTLLQKQDPPTPDPLLKAALVRRAMTDVTRIMRIREDKPALQNLLQKGSIGDELWNSLLAAEKELEAEIMEVAAEANTFVDGWGQVIFATASEVLANEKARGVFEHLPLARQKFEDTYAPKRRKIAAPPATPAAPATPAPVKTPLTPSTTTNGLAPPPSAGAESVVSSDGEAPSPKGSPASPRTPSKSGKKHKKRK